MNIGQVINKFSISKASSAANLLVLCAWGLILVGYVEVVIRHSPIGFLATAFTPALFLFLIAISSRFIGRYCRPLDLLGYILCIAIYIVQYVLFPRNEEVLDEYALRFFFQVLPFYFIGLILDIKEMDRPFYSVSMATIWAVVYVVLIYSREQNGMPTEDEVEEKMSIAYLMLPHVMYVVWHLFRQFSIIGLVTALVGILFLFTCGTRGPLLCLFVFIALYVIIFNSWSKKTKIFVIAIFSIIAALIIKYFENILLIAFDMSSLMGVSNRVFSMVESGEVISHTSGRDQISAVLWGAVENGGLFGYGIGGSWQFVGMYSHNLLLDLLISFGPLIGGCVFIYLVWLIIKGFAKSHDIERGFILMLICGSFFKLFLSHIFLTESMLFLLIGYCIKIIRRSEHGIQNNKRLLENTRYERNI